MKLIINLILLFMPVVASAANIGEVRSVKHWRAAYEKNEKFQKVEYHYTPWCIYCPRQTAIIEELARENPHVLFVKINGDLLKRPQVTSYPTILIKGRQFVGVTSKAVLQSLIDPRPKKAIRGDQNSP